MGRPMQILDDSLGLVHVQSCLTLCHTMDCSLPGFSVHGVSQSRIVEQIAISPFQRMFLTQGSNPVSCASPALRQVLYCWATREATSLGLIDAKLYTWVKKESKKVNIREQKYIRQLLTDLKVEIDSNTIVVENVNTLLRWLDHPDRMSTRKQWP